MDFEEAERQRVWLMSGHIKKLGYQNACTTVLFNKYPTLDKIDTTFYPTNPDGTKNYKIVDSSVLGIIPGSLAETFNYCSGDPTDPDSKWQNPHEQYVISQMGKLLGIQDVTGYMSSGGTEGNLAAIWWCKTNLTTRSQSKIQELKDRIKQHKNQQEVDYEEILNLKEKISKLRRPYIVATKSPHSHFSVIKVASIIELNTLYIEGNDNGSMNLDSLRDNLRSVQGEEDLTFIVSINFGTTTQAAFDDVFEIRKIFDEMKNPNWKYVVHMDAAMYGPTLPVLKQFGDKSNSLTSCGVDTVAISLWKFLGVQIPCGVSLCTREFIKQGFEPLKATTYKDFPLANDNFILAGTRSGIAAAAAYNIIKTFKLEEGLDILKKFIDYDIEMAIYLQEQLEKIYDKSEIRRMYFNVVFPRRHVPEDSISKFILMKVGKTELQAITLMNVNRTLIDEFINEILAHISNNEVAQAVSE